MLDSILEIEKEIQRRADLLTIEVIRKLLYNKICKRHTVLKDICKQTHIQIHHLKKQLKKHYNYGYCFRCYDKNIFCNIPAIEDNIAILQLMYPGLREAYYNEPCYCRGD